MMEGAAITFEGRKQSQRLPKDRIKPVQTFTDNVFVSSFTQALGIEAIGPLPSTISSMDDLRI